MDSITERLVAAFTADSDPLWEQFLAMLHVIVGTGLTAGHREDGASVLRLTALIDHAIQVADAALRESGH